MNRSEFNDYRRESWKKIRDSTSHATTGEYVSAERESDISFPWCNDNPDAFHAFTRQYPYEDQPITIVMDNPRLDRGDPKSEQSEARKDQFPTLEHYRYAEIDELNIERLAEISAEHYSSYFPGTSLTDRLLAAIGSICDNLQLRNVVGELPEPQSWTPGAGDSYTKIDQSLKPFQKYFYNFEKVESTPLNSIKGCVEPHPTEVLPFDTEGLTAGSEGLSGININSNQGFYNDFYITNRYKFGTYRSALIKRIESPSEVHTEVLTDLDDEKGGEIERVDSELIITLGGSAQSGLLESAELLYDNGYADRQTVGAHNYSTTWLRPNGQYVLCLPHKSRWWLNFGSVYTNGRGSDNSEAWEHFDNAISDLESRISI